MIAGTLFLVDELVEFRIVVVDALATAGAKVVWIGGEVLTLDVLILSVRRTSFPLGFSESRFDRAL